MNAEEVKQRIEKLEEVHKINTSKGQELEYLSNEVLLKVKKFCDFWQLFSDLQIYDIYNIPAYQKVEIICKNENVVLRVCMLENCLHFELSGKGTQTNGSFDLRVESSQRGDFHEKTLYVVLFNQILDQFKFSSRYIDITKKENK
jgi:hypothetical protein